MQRGAVRAGARRTFGVGLAARLALAPAHGNTTLIDVDARPASTLPAGVPDKVAPVPEPSMPALLAVGGVASLTVCARRRKRTRRPPEAAPSLD